MLYRDYQFRGRSFKIACMEPYPQHPSWYTFEDEVVVRDAVWHIGDGDLILDVGSGYGSYAITGLVSGAARVFAWSPQSQDSESPDPSVSRFADKDFFQESLRQNGWLDKCEIYSHGVYDRSGWLNADTQEFSEFEVTGHDWIKVDVLDKWLKEDFLPRFDPSSFKRVWMKLDVEGAELNVLQGAMETIRVLRPTILVENHRFKDPSLEPRVRDLIVGGGSYRETYCAPYHAVAHSLFEPVV